MAREKREARRVAAARVSDEELIAWLEEEAPQALTVQIPEAVFDPAVEGCFKESPSPRGGPRFYWGKCGEYHLKTHPHHRAPK
jgi:hypothetical protein